MNPGGGPLDAPPAGQIVVDGLQRVVARELGKPVDVLAVADIEGRPRQWLASPGTSAPDVAWPGGGSPGPLASVVQHDGDGVVLYLAVRAAASVDWSTVTDDMDAAAEVLAAMVVDQVALDVLRQDVTDLAAAMRSREVIDQAMGVVMAQELCSPAHAFEILRTVSHRTDEKVYVVAARVVADVAGAPSGAARPFARRPQQPAARQHDARARPGRSLSGRE